MGDRTIEHELRDGVLVVTMSGVRPHDDGEYFHDAIGAWSLVAELCERHRVDRLLVEIALAGESTSVRARTIASSIEQVNIPQGLRVAVVNRDERARRHTEFSAKIAQANGRSVQVFATTEEAMAWLQSAAS